MLVCEFCSTLQATPASAEVRDPRGSFFSGSDVTPKHGHGSKQQSPSAETSSLVPLPQRKKRAQAETTTPRRDGGLPAKRRSPGSGVASAARSGNDKESAVLGTSHAKVLPLDSAVATRDECGTKKHGTSKVR